MPLLKTVILPLDGSVFAQAAIPYAVELTRLYGARLVLLRVLHEPLPIFDRASRQTYWPGIGDGRLELPRPDLLEPVIDRLEQQGIHPRSVIRLGAPVAEIVAEAELHPDAALVLASHGRGGWSRMTLGSITTGLIASTTRPVLVVRPQPDHLQRVTIRRLVVLLDGSWEAEGALEPAVSLALAAMGTIRLVRVVEAHEHHTPGEVESPAEEMTVRVGSRRAREADATDYLEHLTGRLRARGVDAAWEILCGDPADELPVFLQRDQPDIAVMATHGRGRLGRWLSGSMADHILRTCETPVLLTRTALPPEPLK